MTLALYKDDSHPKDSKILEQGVNTGLFWGKFFNGFNATFTDFADKESSKRDFLRNFTGNRGDGSAINAAALRQIALTEALGGVWFIASNTDASPFVTGTGNSHPVENGFLWHHTLSAPYMQGSAVKGIMRSWLETQLGYAVNEDNNHSELKRYFGSETKESSDNQAGNLIFFDALPIAQPDVTVEIMTPHLGDYYAKGIKEAGKPNTIPADWHSPTPIPLLAVESISLLFCIAPRLGKIDAQELAHLSIALQNALANMGAGAKTQTGFGRLIVDEAQRKKLEDKLEEQQKQQAKANASVEQQLILEANDIIHASPAAMLMAGQTNAVKIDALLKKTEGWSEADCAAIWNNVVIAWIEKAYSDKAKRKEQYKKVTAKYAWLKAPQS